MSEKQTDGRRRNGASPGGKPDASTPTKNVEAVGGHERRSAGPDGPDATAVGNTFKT